MKKLIEEADKARVQVKDKEIILFLGNTGAGKSTTIHFLAGSEMAR
jgi:ABC-type sugar transport system ATPase subunit